MIGYGVAGLIGLAVLAGIVVVIVSAGSKNDGGERPHRPGDAARPTASSPTNAPGTTVAGGRR